VLLDNAKLLLEGGGKINGSFLEAHLIDELKLFTQGRTATRVVHVGIETTLSLDSGRCRVRGDDAERAPCRCTSRASAAHNEGGHAPARLG